MFHAGDGNLHPHVLFNADDAAAQARALEASHEILRMCIRFGGTISGEHGVGIEKRSMMLELFAETDLEVMGGCATRSTRRGGSIPARSCPRAAGVASSRRITRTAARRPARAPGFPRSWAACASATAAPRGPWI